MIKLRLDVDYPYPSRAKSFVYIALGIKKRADKKYLRNARIIAKMINASPKQIMAYWFFTPYTIPNKALLDLLSPDKHEVAMHIATNPYREWKILENETESNSKILHDSWNFTCSCSAVMETKTGAEASKGT